MSNKYFPAGYDFFKDPLNIVMQICADDIPVWTRNETPKNDKQNYGVDTCGECMSYIGNLPCCGKCLRNGILMARGSHIPKINFITKASEISSSDKIAELRKKIASLEDRITSLEDRITRLEDTMNQDNAEERKAEGKKYKHKN